MNLDTLARLFQATQAQQAQQTPLFTEPGQQVPMMPGPNYDDPGIGTSPEEYQQANAIGGRFNEWQPGQDPLTGQQGGMTLEQEPGSLWGQDAQAQQQQPQPPGMGPMQQMFGGGRMTSR